MVDSPANPIDLKVRNKVAELIPKLSDQFVAFTISPERNGFVPPLEQAAGVGLQLLTLFRKGDADLETQAAREPNVEMTTDGILVPGREFFYKFHVEAEGGN